MSKRKTTNYSLEFKRSSAQLAANSDQPISKTAIELGVNINTLHGWVKKFNPTTIKREQQEASEYNNKEELMQLRKENARLRQERDILKKAAAYFAGEIS